MCIYSDDLEDLPGAAATVTAQFAEYVTPSTVIEAVTVQVPALTGVIVPLLTVAIVVSELVQVTAEPTGVTVALTLAVVLGSVAVAVSADSSIVGIVPSPSTKTIPFSARSLK